MDLCAGTYTAAKSFLQFEHHRNFIEKSVDSEVVVAVNADLVLAFTSLLLSPRFNISNSKKSKDRSKSLKNPGG